MSQQEPPSDLAAVYKLIAQGRQLAVRWVAEPPGAEGFTAIVSWIPGTVLQRPFSEVPPDASGLLERAPGYLKSLAATDSTTLAPEASSAKKIKQLSKTDRELLKQIGRQDFESLTNAELWRRYRVRLKLTSGLEAFRASCNRIRRHCGLPSSEAIRKKSGQTA